MTPSFTKDQIREVLKAAINQLLKSDADILKIDINERTISARLANYLDHLFPGWHVDCEYNRDRHDPKYLDIIPRHVSSDDTHATTVFPDIIVHRRCTDQNLLVIEMKKTTSSENNDYDKRKLRAFRKQLGYCYAVFIKLKTKGELEFPCIQFLEDRPAAE